MGVSEFLLSTATALVLDKGPQIMDESDDIVEGVHHKDEPEDADQEPPDLARLPESLHPSYLYPKQALGAETACHQVHAICEGLAVVAQNLRLCYGKGRGIISRSYHREWNRDRLGDGERGKTGGYLFGA
jgi:hypothetical protein